MPSKERYLAVNVMTSGGIVIAQGRAGRPAGGLAGAKGDGPGPAVSAAEWLRV